MAESKSTATDRLRREGRWNEASMFKDETIANHRRAGMGRQDAQAAGWAAMLEKFPPSGEHETAESYFLADDLALSTGENGSDFVNSAFWVFDNLARRVSPNQAPSSGAWAMLEWARTNKNDFFKSIVPKALDIKAKEVAGGELEAMEEMAETVELEKLLDLAASD
ncbi:MAG: hypothetical protein SH868_19455 [Bythopirellula sp.]|nr:hypothetical protein [Bythopirellula sp.]